MEKQTPPTAPQRFAAVVAPAAHRAGYTGRGSNARLARDTGIAESTISRMLQGKTIPDVRAFEPLARAIGLTVAELLTSAGFVSAQSLSETRGSRVNSRPITPEEAADDLGIADPVDREMFFAMVTRLRGRQHGHTPAAHSGGMAAEN